MNRFLAFNIERDGESFASNSSIPIALDPQVWIVGWSKTFWTQQSLWFVPVLHCINEKPDHWAVRWIYIISEDNLYHISFVFSLLFRNLFFRISHLTQLGVKLVFAIEGDAPEMKIEVMCKRQQGRSSWKSKGSQGAVSGNKGRQKRSHFKRILKEVFISLNTVFQLKKSEDTNY